jgi:hypothetical protein
MLGERVGEIAIYPSVQLWAHAYFKKHQQGIGEARDYKDAQKPYGIGRGAEELPPKD